MVVDRSQPTKGFGQDGWLGLTFGRLDGGVISLDCFGDATGSLLLLRVP
jgi:hypothetical protein